MTDPELDKFSPGLRKRFHVHYERQARYQRNSLTLSLICFGIVAAWLAYMIWGTP